VFLALIRDSVRFSGSGVRTGASEDQWMVAPGCDE
jgi:hypothetical protein